MKIVIIGASSHAGITAALKSKKTSTESRSFTSIDEDHKRWTRAMFQMESTFTLKGKIRSLA